MVIIRKMKKKCKVERKGLALVIMMFMGMNVFGQTYIGGIGYYLSKDMHEAQVANNNSWTGELSIPAKVIYQGEAYTVTSIEWLAFNFCKTLTKVRIPATVRDIEHYAYNEECKNPFYGCTSLESIEVDEDNQWMCSVDGVLFNKDKTRLYSYPPGARMPSYTVPEGVTMMCGSAFAFNSHLTEVVLPNSVTRMAFSAFANCKSLKLIKISQSISHIPASAFESCVSLRYLDIPESVSSFSENVFRWSPIEKLVIRGTFPGGLRKDTFSLMEGAVIYVQRSEVEKFKKVYSGTVLPLDYLNVRSVIDNMNTSTLDCFDLQGRRLANPPAKGVYIRDGKKVVR